MHPHKSSGKKATPIKLSKECAFSQEFTAYGEGRGLFVQTRFVKRWLLLLLSWCLIFYGQRKIGYIFFTLNKNSYILLYKYVLYTLTVISPFISFLPTMSTQLDDRHSATSPLHKSRDKSFKLSKLHFYLVCEVS